MTVLTPARLTKFRSLIKRGPECHIWQGGRNGHYGCFYSKETTVPSRIAWILEHGIPPADMKVVATCQNYLCCNPGHLKLVPNKEAATIRRAA